MCACRRRERGPGYARIYQKTSGVSMSRSSCWVASAVSPCRIGRWPSTTTPAAPGMLGVATSAQWKCVSFVGGVTHPKCSKWYLNKKNTCWGNYTQNLVNTLKHQWHVGEYGCYWLLKDMPPRDINIYQRLITRCDQALLLDSWVALSFSLAKLKSGKQSLLQHSAVSLIFTKFRWTYSGPSPYIALHDIWIVNVILFY